MRPERLKALICSYIENKRGQDVIDGAGGYLAAEFDDPGSHPQFGGVVCDGGGSLSPVSPTQFFPFGMVTSQSSEVIEVGKNLVQLASKFSFAHPDKSIIRFEEICMVEEPKEQIISIPVIRLKSFTDKITEVSWKTCDKTAHAGSHYIGSNGQIRFDKGETKKNIEIRILDSSDEADDLRFTIELTHVGGLFDPTPITISLKKISQLYDDERQVLHNLPHSLPFSIADIKSALDGCMNNRTFHLALTHLCSTRNAVDIQFALACELSTLCFNKLSGESVLNVLTDFFRMDIDF